MASIIAPVDDSFKNRIELFSWVNWSEVARFELNKRRISEEYRKTRKLSAEDQEFCDEADWHPVDELPLKKEFVKKLEMARKGPHISMSMDELEKLMGL